MKKSFIKFPLTLLKKIRDHLVKEKKRIGKRISSLRLQDPYSDPDRLLDNAASDADAKEESSHERMEALEKELRFHLKEIEKALARIKKGTYGKCLLCGKMINTERLAIKPTALHCIECERKKDK